MNALLALAALAAALLGIWVVRRRALLRRVQERTERTSATPIEAVGDEPAIRDRPRGWSGFPRLAVWLTAALAGLVLLAATELGPALAAAAAVLVLVVGLLVVDLLRMRQERRIDQQLAHAIDHMVGSLQAGAGVLESLRSATEAAPSELRARLGPLVDRIQVGERLGRVFREQARRTGKESLRILYFVLAVQGEGGGSLVPALVTIGRLVRDRADVRRRIRTQTVEARFGALFALLLTWFLALLMWHAYPERVEGFLQTEVGRIFTALTVVLQALGTMWIARLARVRY